MGGLADLPAFRGVIGLQLGLIEFDRGTCGGVSEVEQRTQGDFVSVHASGEEVLRSAALASGEAVELADRGLTLEREVERGEAVGWVPASAVQARPSAGEWMAVVGDVPEGLCGKSERVERVDSCEELGVDHAV